MSIDKKKAKLDAATEVAAQKRIEFLDAHLKAKRLEEKYEAGKGTSESKKLCDEWWKAYLGAENCKFEAKEAERKEQRALEAFDKEKAKQ